MRPLLISLIMSSMLALPVQAAPKVVATLPVLGLIAETLSGDADVTVLITGHEDPHHVALTPKERLALSQADLIIRAGAVEEGMDHVLSIDRLRRKMIIADQLIVQAEGLPDDQLTDPDLQHFWFDPSLVHHVYSAVAAWLDTDPHHLRNVDSDLQKLDQEIATMLAPYQGRGIVTLHGGLGRYLKRYGLTPLAHAAHDHEAGMSAGEMAHLRHELEAHPGACLIAGKDMASSSVDAMTAGTETRVLRVDFIGAQSASYGQMMRRLTEGLIGCFTP